MDKIESLRDWLMDKHIIPRISNSKFKIQNIKITVPDKNLFYLSSDIYFVNIKFINNDETFYLVVKKPPFDLAFKGMNIHELFNNEVIFYKEFIEKNTERFPKCFYAFAEKNDCKNTGLVMLDISKFGWEMSEQSTDIPFEFVIAGVQEIARFHGMSYSMKTKNAKKFFSIVDKLQEPRFVEDGWHKKFLHLYMGRPIKNLAQRKICDSKFLDLVEPYMRNAFEKIMLESIKSKEPLSVLCHGDFAGHNIFFKKENNTIKAMLIDFGMVSYSSPAIDVSSFMFLSAQADDRKNRFNEIFKAYHDALIKYLKEERIGDLSVYLYNLLLADFKRYACFGFVIAIFLKPCLRGYMKPTDYNLPVDINRENFDRYFNAGGIEMSNELGDMLVELKDIGSFEHLNHC